MMNSKFNLIVTSLMAFVIAGTFTSCKKDIDKESNPEVKITGVSSDVTSIVFSLEATGSKEAAYVVVSSEEEIPAANTIFNVGTVVPVEKAEYTVTDLYPATKYFVGAVSKAQDGRLSKVEVLEMSTISSDGMFTFDVVTSDVTPRTFKLSITPSSSEARYVYGCDFAVRLAAMTDQELYASYLESFEKQAKTEGKTLEQVLSEELASGNVTNQEIGNLEPEVGYTVFVFGMDPKVGFITSKVVRKDVMTPEAQMSFELSVTDVTASSAHVTVTPSDEQTPFIWLCEPTSKYPDMTGAEIAAAYVEQNKEWLDQGMGFYTGIQDFPQYKLIPSTEYYLIAFAYKDGEVYTDVAEKFFESDQGGDPATFACEIEIEPQAETAAYKVTTSTSDIFYMCAHSPKADYNKDEAMEFVENYIADFVKAQQEWNPTYTVVEALESQCSMGDSEGTLVPLAGGTEYTFFAVPVDLTGKPADAVATKDFTTLSADYSKADVTSVYKGTFNLAELQEAGYFEGQSSAKPLVAVYELVPADECVVAKYKLWYGVTDELTDAELMSFIDPYWDGEKSGDDLTNGRLVFITNQYYNQTTFITVGQDENGKYSKLGRTFVQALAEGEEGTLEEFEAIYNEFYPQGAPKLNASRK